MADNAWKLQVRDFRGLANIHWSPAGVCLLAGPNGSGKTTLLRALQFLHNFWRHDLSSAVRWAGGPAHLCRRGAEPEALVQLVIEVEDLAWTIEIAVEGAGINPYHGERLVRGGETIFDVRPYETEWQLNGERRARGETRCLLRDLDAKWEPGWLTPIVDFLSGVRVYESYWLNRLREPHRETSLDPFLHNTGQNLWGVLQNWKAAPRRFRGQFEWVLEYARKAFPETLKDLEFEQYPIFFPPDSRDPDDYLPIHLAPDGLLTGLLHLTAAAGARDRSLIAIDEVENQLHPHAIRAIMAAMREMADMKDLTVVLTTHSPVVMNEFKGYEDQFYILGEDTTEHPELPVPLTKAHDPEWVAHYALGDLYEREKIARQRGAASDSA